MASEGRADRDLPDNSMLLVSNGVGMGQSSACDKKLSLEHKPTKIKN